MKEFEEIRKEIEKSGKTPEEIARIFSSFGLTPENPELARKLLEEADLEDLTPEKISEKLKKISDSIPPELKKQMADLIMELSNYIPAGPMPEDVKKFIESWKKAAE
ncbi:hypothetical protein SAMN05660826_02219 [Caldanaerovirga acetigignens]|uniref:Uncharacterized protein n=1 Tax=Caldanaerovirga acetigignens TaxID=447595 RepID=A0A1M7M9V5_9FIRM|nr:hypothetical protein [Caldanaerovirga acetigignens]SHM87533.1 hypothetical protein SAMN05660826_02219 [Caldanaerovirga acetigignens]